MVVGNDYGQMDNLVSQCKTTRIVAKSILIRPNGNVRLGIEIVGRKSKPSVVPKRVT